VATVDANGVAHYYEEHGSGPVVMLLHGGLESSASWDLQVPALAEAHRVVLVDRRGHGRTADVAGPISYALMRDDTIACIEALDLAGAHLVGWSDGGIIGLDGRQHGRTGQRRQPPAALDVCRFSPGR